MALLERDSLFKRLRGKPENKVGAAPEAWLSPLGRRAASRGPLHPAVALE